MEKLLEELAGHWSRLLLLLALQCCSFFFSATEAALFSLRRPDRDEMTRRGGPGAAAALALLADPRGLLASVLFGNLVANVLIFAISAVLGIELSTRFGPSAYAACGATALGSVILFGEIAPKFVALSFPSAISRVFALPMQFFYGVVTPVRVALVWLMRRFEGGSPASPHLVAEELSDLIEMAGREGTIGEHERRLVQEAVDLAELRVSHIMIPRVDMVACDASWPASRLVLLAADTDHGRFPVYRGGLDEVVGVADVFDALREPNRPLGELAHPAKFVPEQKKVTELLAEFRAEGREIAVVSDEFGGTAGLVTLEDVVEEVVGDIRDPDERHRPAPVVRLSDTRYLLAGDLAAEPWAEAIDVDPDDLGVDRLGGLVAALLGRIPREGDTVRRGDLSFTVRRMRRRRVVEVLLELASEDAGDGIDELDEARGPGEPPAPGGAGPAAGSGTGGET